MRKHFFNEDYFEVIDSEQKAYWLGFISADGSVTKTSKWNSYRLQINLHQSDKDHLELFKKHIGASTSDIYDFENDSSSRGFGKSDMSRFVLNSIKLYGDLNRLNVTINKTDSIVMPNLRKDLIRHYIRGFIDGDGSFSYVPRKDVEGKYRFSFEIVGNSRIIFEQFQDYFMRKGVKLNIYQRKNGNSFRLMSASHGNIIKLSNIIYNDATVYLKRKYEKSQDIKSLAYCTRNLTA